MSTTAHPATEPAPLRHTVIRASAGTGKTFALSSRYLQLLGRGRESQSILATTFTRKAAGEILQRVLLRLARGAQSGAEARKLADELGQALTLADCRRLLVGLCGNLHGVAISTIDGFFNRIVQSFRHELEIPPQAAIVAEDDPRAEELRGLAIEELLADSDPAIMLDLLQRLHHDGQKRSITAAIDKIVSDLYALWREAPDVAVWSKLEAPPAPRLDLDKLREELEHAKTLVTNSTLIGTLDGLIEKLALESWKEVLGTGVVGKAAVGDTLYRNKPLPAPLADVLKRLALHGSHELIALHQRRLLAMHELMEHFGQRYERLRREHRLLLFSDLPHRLLQHVNQESGEDLREQIAYRLDRRVGHLLLDEFQDTSVQQWQVLLPFAQEIVSHGDDTRTFFCVGDLKQSIYGWRGGCADIFDHVESEFAGQEILTDELTLSRRSAQVVLDAVNRVFSSLTTSPALKNFPASAERWQAGYQEHRAHHRKLPGYATLLTSSDGEDGAEDAEETPTAVPRRRQREDEGLQPLGADPHLEFTAQLVQDLVERGPGRSIGVLTRRNAIVNQMIGLLKRRGVPASGEGGNPLTDDPGVMLALSAITLADHPGDTAAAFHVLHSPLAADLGLSGLSPEHLAEVAARLRRQLLEQGYAATLSRWARILAPHVDARGAARLTQLIALGDSHDPSLTLRPGAFRRMVEGTAVEEPSAAAVRVMTVHKAKGLEFDAVVLCDLEGLMCRMQDTSALPLRDSPVEPIHAIVPGGSKELRQNSPMMQEAYRQGQELRLRDALCSLYVAMTRARQGLYLVLRPLKQIKNGTGARGYSDESAATIVRHAFEDLSQPESFAGRQVLFEAGDADWLQKPRPGEAPSGHAATEPESQGELTLHLDSQPAQTRRSWRRISPTGMVETTITVADLLALESTSARQRGALIHAWFQQVQWLEDGEPTDDALRAIARALDFPEERTPLVLGDFRKMLGRPAVREALRRPKVGGGLTLDLWRERPIAVRLDQQLLQGVIDRAVIQRDGAGRAVRADILDFKTDRIRQPQDAARLTQHYQPQLRAYRAALQRLLRLEDGAVGARLLLVGDEGGALQA